MFCENISSGLSRDQNGNRELLVLVLKFTRRERETKGKRIIVPLDKSLLYLCSSGIPISEVIWLDWKRY